MPGNVGKAAPIHIIKGNNYLKHQPLHLTDKPTLNINVYFLRNK